eukprot:490896-Ditylum_brightwellii.AAC.1
MMTWAQHATGISKPILKTYDHLPHLESKWIKQLCTDLTLINAKIYIHNTWTYPPTCQFDMHIMDDILQYIKSLSIIRKLNYCRLFLQVTCVSNIATSGGKQLIDNIFSNPHEFTNQ